MTSDLNSLNIKQTTTNDVRNQGPGLWRDKHVNHIERGNIDTPSSMVNNSTNINKANNHLSSQPIEHKKDSWQMTLEIQVLAWDRHKAVLLFEILNFVQL
jgi:hypothetical protein